VVVIGSSYAFDVELSAPLPCVARPLMGARSHAPQSPVLDVPRSRASARASVSPRAAQSEVRRYVLFYMPITAAVLGIPRRAAVADGRRSGNEA
jgi:hypothetical protein